jgi:hypothetical protein
MIIRWIVGAMLRIKLRFFQEQMRVIWRYYRRARFFFVDAALFFLYFFSNPYRMCRRFLEKRGEKDVYTYGETPLTALETMVRAFGITAEDRWLDLGCGRGRGCFWMSTFWGTSSRGIEWVPGFISRASWIVWLGLAKKTEFQNSSMEKADFSWPTVVYLCGTCMSDEEIEEVSIPMQALPVGSKVITISEPLKSPAFKILQSIPVSFIWGKTDAYFHEKRAT